MASTYQARELDAAGEATSAMMPGLVDIVSTWQLVGVDGLVAVSVGADVGSQRVWVCCWQCSAVSALCQSYALGIGRSWRWWRGMMWSMLTAVKMCDCGEVVVA